MHEMVRLGTGILVVFQYADENLSHETSDSLIRSVLYTE